jgi:YkoY family integral membrane protein
LAISDKSRALAYVYQYFTSNFDAFSPFLQRLQFLLMNELLQQIIKEPGAALLIIGNLILIESLLSVDNAAVLATMVVGLEKKQRQKALQYGIIGAYLFRGICLIFATYLVGIWWLKPLGGIYLIYLFLKHLDKKRKGVGHAKEHKAEGRLYQATVGRLGHFWATVISIEIMDLAFSLDNVFAAVAFSNNIIIIMTGVFIGILAMRFVAGFFVKLMEKYPFLEFCAFMVIGLLGFKLAFSVYEHFKPEAPLTKFLESKEAEWAVSGLTLAIFFVPIITSLLFNVPRRKKQGNRQNKDIKLG